MLISWLRLKCIWRFSVNQWPYMTLIVSFEMFFSFVLSFCSIPFRSVPFWSVLFRSVPFLSFPFLSDLIWSNLFCSVLVLSVLFRPVPFPVPFWSDLIWSDLIKSDLFCSVPFRSIPFYSFSFRAFQFFPVLLCSFLLFCSVGHFFTCTLIGLCFPLTLLLLLLKGLPGNFMKLLSRLGVVLQYLL